MEIYPETSPTTKHCGCNISWFSEITDITNTVTQMPNAVFGKWTCRPAMFVDFLQCSKNIIWNMWTLTYINMFVSAYMYSINFLDSSSRNIFLNLHPAWKVRFSMPDRFDCSISCKSTGTLHLIQVSAIILLEDSFTTFTISHIIYN